MQTPEPSDPKRRYTGVKEFSSAETDGSWCHCETAMEKRRDWLSRDALGR